MSREELTRVIAGVTDTWDEPLDEVHDIPQIVSAILAHDAANGVHRIRLDDATVERAARALDPKAWDETAIMFVAHGQTSEAARENRKKYARADALRVLAAAAKEDG